MRYITWNVHHKTKEIKNIYACISYIRPLLEYCVQVKSLSCSIDLNMLKSVGREGTRLIPSFRRKKYKERLRALNLFSTEKTYRRGDMIEIYKMFKGLTNLNIDDFFLNT